MKLNSIFAVAILLAGLAHGGAFTCPDQTFPSVPMSGITGGTATSCGNAGVDVAGGFAATPGNGTVDLSVLVSYLGVDLSPLAPSGFGVTEGSAVQFAGFTAVANTQLTFSWESNFEEGGTGSLFYVLNGSVIELDVILPEGQGLPGASNSGTVTANLLTGSNTFAFGAVSLENTTRGRITPQDPQLTITNLAVTPLNDVPEPGTFGMLGIGLAGLAVLARRR